MPPAGSAGKHSCHCSFIFLPLGPQPLPHWPLPQLCLSQHPREADPREACKPDSFPSAQSICH